MAADTPWMGSPDTSIIQKGFDLYRENMDKFNDYNKNNTVNAYLNKNTVNGVLDEAAFLNDLRRVDATKAQEYENYFTEKKQKQEAFRTQQDQAQSTLAYNKLVYKTLENKQNMEAANFIGQRVANAQDPSQIPGILDMAEKYGVDVSKWRNMKMDSNTLNDIKSTVTTYSEALAQEHEADLKNLDNQTRLNIAQAQAGSRENVAQTNSDTRLQTAQIGADSKNYATDKNYASAIQRTQTMAQRNENQNNIDTQKLDIARQNLAQKAVQIQNTKDYQLGKINQQNAFGILGRLGNLSSPDQIDGALSMMQAAGIDTSNLQNMPKDENTLNTLKDIALDQKDKMANDLKQKGIQLRGSELDQRERFAKIGTAKDKAEFSLKTNKEVNDLDKDAAEFRSAATTQKSNFNNTIKAVDQLLADPLLVEFFSLPYAERMASDNGVYKLMTSGKYAPLWSRINQLSATKFIEIAQKMKGLGALSDTDAKRIEEAYGTIKPEIDAARVSEILQGIINNATTGLNNLNTDYQAYVNNANQNRNDLLLNLQSYDNPEANLNLNQSPPVNLNQAAQQGTTLPVGSANISGPAPAQTPPSFAGIAASKPGPAQMQGQQSQANPSIIGSQLQSQNRQQ